MPRFVQFESFRKCMNIGSVLIKNWEFWGIVCEYRNDMEFYSLDRGCVFFDIYSQYNNNSVVFFLYF